MPETNKLPDRMTAAEFIKMQSKQKKGGVNRFPTGPIGGDATRVILPLPYSKNQEYKNHCALSKVQAHWKNLATVAWVKAGKPKANGVIRLRFYFKDNRHNDEDNRKSTVAYKGLIDGLKGRMFGDDCWQELRQEASVLGVDNNCPRLEVEIVEARDGQD